MCTGQGQSLAEVLSTHALLPLAWESSWEAARFLRDDRPADLLIYTKSTSSDLVSEMDKGAEDLLIAALLGDRPTDGILGEEGGERFGTSGVRWVLDPLDGTVNYLHHMPTWGVSVAAEQEGGTVIGVVVTPAFDEAYIGVKGVGAWVVKGSTATAIQVSGCSRLIDAVVATGFGYAAERRRAQGRVVHHLLSQVSDIRRIGAAVIDYCWLARGRLDAYYERGLNTWDIAAGALIAAEAGAVVTGLRDEDIYGSLMIAAAPAIADELRDFLIAADADRE
ncbi:MAG: inositol monophosphatase [Candidatus Nanopelagicales bacterium]|nr:inositol monophosphatase [Candidatus Nanopelagicales bacterium]